MVEKPKFRLFVEGAYAAGKTLVLSETQAHYATHVMRAHMGDAVLVFGGQEGEWLAHLVAAGKKEVAVKLDRQTRPQRKSPDLWLAFAPVKAKTDIIVEKATELGAMKILPVIMRHSVVMSVNEKKLAVHAMEAAEQCERLDVPVIEPYPDLQKLLDAWPKDRPLLYGDETGQGAPLKSVLPQVAIPCGLLIGPEGGFSKEEHALLKSKSFVRAFTMGPRILRADTAATSALACVQMWLGDWDMKPRFSA